MKNIFKLSVFAFLVMLIAGSCKKLDRPALGNYPPDANPPGGPLKFYAAFDGTSANPLMNAVDSIRANFPSSNPLATVDGVSGKALKGLFDKAVKYPSANDFAKSTSFTISFWIKNTPWAGGPGFVLSLTNKDYWHNSAIFLLFEDQGQSSTTAATMKFAVMDQWFEFAGAKILNKPVLNGQWHHMVFVYDETTSKIIYYIDGIALTGLDPSLTDVKNGANPRGPLKLTDAGNASGSLVLGGWNKQVGLNGPTDAWIQGFNGGLDQFRFYGKVLTAAEILALYNSKL
jgi:Concanavalin A-like lectin/glucanases superfamily